MPKSSLASSMLAVLLLAMGACAPSMSGEKIEMAQRGSTFDRIGDYKIGPSDILAVKVFGEESLSGQYAVTPSGLIQFPLIGFVSCKGLTPEQLSRRLETQLRPFVKVPKVVVSIGDPASFRVFFSGEVTNRGGRELKTKTSLLEGLLLAGGLTDFSSGKIYLIRRVNDREVKRYVTEYSDILRGKKGLDNFFLERGDIIHAD